MNSTRRKEINKLAELVRKACEATSPVNMEEAVRRLGGEIVEDSTIEPEAQIEKTDAGFRVKLHPSKTKNRKNFSIAHEIGHLFIHMGYIIDPEKWEAIDKYEDSVYARYGHSHEEHEANEFAAAFLMPQEEFNSSCERNCINGNCNLYLIAADFGVSIDAALTRGKWLGKFPWKLEATLA